PPQPELADEEAARPAGVSRRELRPISPPARVVRDAVRVRRDALLRVLLNRPQVCVVERVNGRVAVVAPAVARAAEGLRVVVFAGLEDEGVACGARRVRVVAVGVAGGGELRRGELREAD